MVDVKQETQFFKSLFDILEAQLGENSEIVLHDLTDKYEHTIVDIRNGHITKRSIGDCGSNLGLEVLRGTENDGNRYNYITNTKDGKILRSSTMFIRNESGGVIAAICINRDISKLLELEKVLHLETRYSGIDTNGSQESNKKEVFVNNINELLDFLIQEAFCSIGKQVMSMDREDKRRFLKYLDEKGAFIISKSGDKVCEFLGISKYTLYNYLESVRKSNSIDNSKNEYEKRSVQ